MVVYKRSVLLPLAMNLLLCISRAEGNLRDLAGLAGETVEDVVGEGKEFVDSKKAVLREAFDAGREAMRRERDRLREEDHS